METTTAKPIFHLLEATGLVLLTVVKHHPQLHQHLHDAVEFPTQIGTVATEENLVILEVETAIGILTALVISSAELTIARLISR